MNAIKTCLCVAFVLIYMPSAIAQGTEAPPQKPGLIEKLLPSLHPKDTYDPYTTMKAPFADAPAEEEAEDINIYRQTREERFKTLNGLQKNLANSANAVPIDQPHASLPEIKDWLVTTISSAMTFSDKSGDELQAVLPSFTENGRKQYLAFLQKNGIIGILKSRKYRVNTIFQEPPLLIKEALAEDGRYKWSFEAELLTTYLPLTAKDYRAATARNENFTLQLQITRAPKEENPQEGLLIEIWQVKNK